MLRRTALLAPLLFALACQARPPGQKLASGIARELTVAKGWVAFLLDAAHPDDRAVPDDLFIGDLWLAPLDGAAKKVGSAVSSQPGAFAFSPKTGELAFLASWRFRGGEGELWIASPEPAQIAPAASDLAWSTADATLAWVAPNHLGLRGRPAVPLDGLRSFAWSPDGKRLAGRASAAAGGTLWLVDVATGSKREVAPGTSDFAFASDGSLAVLGPPPPKGGDRPLLVDGKEIARATAMRFSPDARELALLSTARQPGEAMGDLYRMPRTGGAPRLVAQRVSDYHWHGSDLLCLAKYDLRARAGALTVSPAGGGAPREIAPKVQSWVAQGRSVLYLAQAPLKGDYKIELWAADLDSAAPPRKIDDGVYGWQVSPDGSLLYYKARCAMGPRSCSLLRAPMDGSAPATFLAANVAGFDLSADGSRILLEQPHRGATRAVDLAVIPARGAPPAIVKPFAEEADASARFADAQGKRVVFATLTAGKGGVYAADVP
ncbi:MAG TPA: hypothetical protein VF993_06510 [Myxococcales bacterium]